ncbi:MAG TPA: MFS transporter [Treponemataceae bacterium]|nr:MFS transporter [Treponemataceae bacterium]HPS44458.1 MFS transporter [Treponemataceae bacterium]
MKFSTTPARALERVRGLPPELKLYLAALAISALGLGFSNDIISNYFKDAYNVTPFQRGLIEFPRELPGVITTIVVAILAGFSDIWISIIAQALALAGITVLGFATPTFRLMLLFIFVNSLGQHLFMPLQDSIGMNLVGRANLGKRMGQFKGVTTAFQMLAAIAVFLGFRFGFFSFKTPVKWVFVIAAGLFALVLVILAVLEARTRKNEITHERVRFVIRKKYRLYYALVIMFGVQKQIMLVYGPWVLIELLGKKADTLAILGIIGSACGVFFIPALGRWLDRFGIKAMLYADALSFIGVYLLYGLVSGGYASGALPTVGWTVFLAYGVFVVDRMSTQMGIIRTVYLRTIAVDPRDVTPTLSLGMSMDHTVSIACAFAGGIVWSRWGPQYIFYLAAALSLVNLYVAIRVRLPEGK